MNHFQEEQRFTQWWLWLLMGGSALAVVIPFIMQLTSGDPVGSNPAPTIVLGLVSLLTLGLLYFLTRLRLKTDMDDHSIRFDYGVFGKKNIKWSEVEKAEVLDYGFVGYGLRLTRKYGTVYNVGGKYGLFLLLKSGKKITIGSQKEGELEAFLKVGDSPTSRLRRTK